MPKTERRWLLGLTLAFLGSGYPVQAQVQMSGGIDGRFQYVDNGHSKGVLEGLFLNARKAFKDSEGDRVILVGQMDADDNFEKIRPYQTYAQYKGGLGRWNLRAGHYILPFGLLSDYDTERLLLRSIELTNLGLKLDTGVEALGFVGPVDYAVSVSQGVGRRRLEDVDNNKLVTARLGWTADETRLGVSGLIGKVLLAEEVSSDRIDLYERRLGLDLTQPWGPLMVRGELDFGSDPGRMVGGGYVGADYALPHNVEANFKYAHWQRAGAQNSIGGGLSYRFRPGLFFRVADEEQFSSHASNTVTGQIYYEFSKNFF